MTYVVYADVMLLWNIIINIIVLYTSSKILHISINFKHILIWSALTGALTLAEYLLTIHENVLIHHILYAGIYVFMTTIFFERYTLRHILIHTLVILFSMLITYGIVGIVIRSSKTVSTSKIPLTLAGVIIFVFTLSLLVRHNSLSASEYRLKLELNDTEIDSIGYLDSGNFLSDCYTGAPVIILDYRLMNQLLDNKSYDFIVKYHITGNFDYEGISKESNLKFYPLPYRTISSDFSTMPAFRINALTFTDAGKTFSHITAGISRNKLINNNDYRVLLNESLKPDREEYSND